MLAAWLRAHGKSAYWIAQHIGVGHPAVYRWMNGKSVPNVVPAFAIEYVTEGGVPASSWMGTDIARLLWKNMEGRRDEMALKKTSTRRHPSRYR